MATLLTNPVGGIEKVPNTVWNYQAEWGTMRAKLDPLPGTNLYGRQNNFYIHNSHKGRTAGCIEISNAFFTRLLHYRLSHSIFKVVVKYKNDTTPTNGNTKY